MLWDALFEQYGRLGILSIALCLKVEFRQLAMGLRDALERDIEEAARDEDGNLESSELDRLVAKENARLARAHETAVNERSLWTQFTHDTPGSHGGMAMDADGGLYGHDEDDVVYTRRRGR